MSNEKIQWLAWDAGALERAQNDDKMILLDLDATWCHWCHVMENTTYSDPEVVKLIQENFIPIRVDPDRRPDVNERYNQGGWPTTAFLASSGEVVYGATYIPPEQMQNVLRRIIELWQTKRSELQAAIGAYRESLEAERVMFVRHITAGTIPDDVLARTVERLQESFDYAHGGFGDAQAGFTPKFPFPDAVEVCLLHYSLTGDPGALEMSKRTLDGMLTLHDWEEGGFYRYAVNRDWSIPHYEKMLETNASLVKPYLYGWRLFKEPRYRDAISGILRWTTTAMSHPDGGFYGSQDADGENAYYGLNLTERSQMSKPPVDSTVFCDWTAQMARSFLDASVVLGDMSLMQRGLAAIDWLLKHCRLPNGMMYHYWSENEPHVPGMLRDQAQMILALSRAYQISAERYYLQMAIRLAETVMREFYDEAVGCFYDMAAREEIETLEFRRRHNITDNALVTQGLWELAEMTGKVEYRNDAESAVQFFTDRYEAFLPFAASYVMAAWRFTEPQQTVVVVGQRPDPQARRLLMESLRSGCPVGIAYQLDPEEDHERINELGFPDDKKPVAYVCRQTSCQAFETPEALTEAIRERA